MSSYKYQDDEYQDSDKNYSYTGGSAYRSVEHERNVRIGQANSFSSPKYPLTGNSFLQNFNQAVDIGVPKITVSHVCLLILNKEASKIIDTLNAIIVTSDNQDLIQEARKQLNHWNQAIDDCLKALKSN